ncbi:MAG: hypothetical protein U1F43_32450 [Myxococcota bacterium]
MSGHETTLGLPRHGDMFAAQLPDPDSCPLNDPVTRPEDIVGATRARGYDLSCVPSLKVADGAVVLATMAFDLRPKAGHDAEGEACHDGDRAAVRARSWQRGPE